ncbi:hypothetical protein N0V90_004726 [Kalmusia sp. IMI 367209]|nr:hypothetical protein N0V90_004726 [Kalmusia sp. IMI 367209]
MPPSQEKLIRDRLAFIAKHPEIYAKPIREHLAIIEDLLAVVRLHQDRKVANDLAAAQAETRKQQAVNRLQIVQNEIMHSGLESELSIHKSEVNSFYRQASDNFGELDSLRQGIKTRDQTLQEKNMEIEALKHEVQVLRQA